MIKINIDLRNKNLLLGISGFFVCMMLYSIHLTSWDINLTFINYISYYGFAVLGAMFWWIPYQFNNEFS